MSVQSHLAFDSTRWMADRASAPCPGRAVLLHAPSQVFQAPGGGENQLTRTAIHLERRGLPVRPFSSWTDRVECSRLLHIFGMSREGLELARVAKARGVPVVLSPICWHEPRAIRALAPGRLAAAAGLAKWVIQAALPARPGWRRELLMLSDVILPNSLAEAKQLARLFAVDPGKFRVVPNGVERRFAEATPECFRETHGATDFVLFVGRIEPRKNVLGLIRACRGARLPLVVMGDAPPGREGYLAECMAAGSAHARWISAVSHDDPMLASAYAAARVVALPSWFETPGLAALEGALAGRPLVVTPHGCTREYFGDMAFYARPDRPGEIGGALARAWREGPDPRLAPHVASRFLWTEVARQTAEAYDLVAR